MHWERGFVSGRKETRVKERGMTLLKDSSISIEPFDRRGDFTLWQQWLKSLLTRQETIMALKVKTRRTEKMTDDEWVALRDKGKLVMVTMKDGEDLKDMATRTILLCLTNSTLW